MRNSEKLLFDSNTITVLIVMTRTVFFTLKIHIVRFCCEVSRTLLSFEDVVSTYSYLTVWAHCGCHQMALVNYSALASSSVPVGPLIITQLGVLGAFTQSSMFRTSTYSRVMCIFISHRSTQFTKRRIYRWTTLCRQA